METLTDERIAELQLKDADWYDCIALSDEEAARLRELARADQTPSYLSRMVLTVCEQDGQRVHVAKLGKRGSTTAARRRRYLERIGCKEQVDKEALCQPS